jgi:DNA polymerase (family 10)
VPRNLHVPLENAEVARIFREIADLLEIEGANPFRVRAYRTAARTVEEWPESVADLVRQDSKKLQELPGIGADLAGKIEEIVRTGTHSLLSELGQQIPPGVAELLRVPGIGPKRARALYEALGIRTLAQLEDAARKGKIRELPGWGAKTEQKILRELESRRPGPERFLRGTAAPYVEALLEYVRGIDGVKRAEVAGSYRRCRETVGDIDILVAIRKGSPAIERFVAYPEVEEVVARGPTKATVRLRAGLQADIRVLPEVSYGAGLHYFTGSQAHNIAIRRLGQQRGLKINEYGIFRNGKRVGGRTEEEVFRAVGLPWIPPELRENRGEIEAAREGSLPTDLVELADIRGDLQAHTTDSDGRENLEAMARAAEALGYEYLAVTDHTPAVRVAGGLDRAGFRRQMKRIDRLNSRLEKLTLLKGAEVDILPDGSLDLDDDTLAALDVVIVAIHSKFELSARDQTRRIVRALQHPAVDILAHPSARILNRRRGIDVDMEEVIRAAADHGVLLELNAQPDRLDLDDLDCRAAVEQGVRLAINTDAHSTAELRYMRWGVDQARRGWVEKKHVANTRPLKSLLRLLHRGRR